MAHFVIGLGPPKPHYEYFLYNEGHYDAPSVSVQRQMLRQSVYTGERTTKGRCCVGEQAPRHVKLRA